MEADGHGESTEQPRTWNTADGPGSPEGSPPPWGTPSPEPGVGATRGGLAMLGSWVAWAWLAASAAAGGAIVFAVTSNHSNQREWLVGRESRCHLHRRHRHTHNGQHQGQRALSLRVERQGPSRPRRGVLD